MELYCLAELQRMAGERSWLLAECTTWDCAVLPTLNFKPDCLWVFDRLNQVYQNVGACKLDLEKSEIGYVIQLEIVECSRSEHSKSRSVGDDQREQEIRALFNGFAINVGFVYFTVAHKNHRLAHKEDVYFQKTALNEYEVMPARLTQWQTAIEQVFSALSTLAESKSNETIYIGH